MPNPSRRKYQSGGGGAYNVEILGLAELRKVLREAPPEFKKSAARQLRLVGNEVRDAIRATAPVGDTTDRYHKEGNLRKSVKTKVSRLSVRVVSDARAPDSRLYKGYRYGKRIEFDPSIGRPWFYGPWERMQAAIKRNFDEVLDTVMRRLGGK